MGSDPEEVSHAQEKALNLCEKIGARKLMLSVLSGIAQMKIVRRQTADAMATIERVQELSGNMDAPEAAAHADVLSAFCVFQEGQNSKASEMVDKAAAAAKDKNDSN